MDLSISFPCRYIYKSQTDFNFNHDHITQETVLTYIDIALYRKALPNLKTPLFWYYVIFHFIIIIITMILFWWNIENINL